jgi:hypothetical protein
MDFFDGLPTMHKSYDYLFVVFDRFIKIYILMPCKNTIKEHEVENFFFEQVKVQFGIPRSIISDRDTRFLSAFWTTLWENIDTNLNRSTTFHPQTNGKTEVVNKTLLHLFRGYNNKHLKT